MDGGQHGPPRREVWSYHHPSSKPIPHRQHSPLHHDNFEPRLLTRLSRAFQPTNRAGITGCVVVHGMQGLALKTPTQLEVREWQPWGCPRRGLRPLNRQGSVQTTPRSSHSGRSPFPRPADLIENLEIQGEYAAARLSRLNLRSDGCFVDLAFRDLG
jgi:hypothetical protein